MMYLYRFNLYYYVVIIPSLMFIDPFNESHYVRAEWCYKRKPILHTALKNNYQNKYWINIGENWDFKRFNYSTKC